MPRPSHKPVPEEDSVESINDVVAIRLDPKMRYFLETEAKRLSMGKIKQYCLQDVMRALIAAYYEKRMLGFLVNPDD